MKLKGENQLNKKIIFTLIVTCLSMSGCAVQNDKTKFHGLGLTYQSNVKKISDNLYEAEVEAAPAAGRTEGAIGTATKNASDFCKKKNKAFKEVKTEVDTNKFANGVAKLTFLCE